MNNPFNHFCRPAFGANPKALFAVLVFTAAVTAGFAAEGRAQCFIRGDFNNNGVVDGADAADLAGFIFGGVPVPFCMDAADIDDDGVLTPADAALLVAFTGGGAPPMPPFPGCGLDLTPDGLGCTLLRGDMNFSAAGEPPDVVAVLLCVFLGDCSCYCCADVDCSGVPAPPDVVLELFNVFLGAPFPPCPCPSI